MSVMSARQCAIAGGWLLAMCCLIPAAAAFESAQSNLPSGSSSAGSLPAFLDSGRLPQLQEAWRTRETSPAGAPLDEQSPAPQETAPAQGSATPADAAAMKGAKQQGRGTGGVRQRAEELSGRFSAGDDTTATENSTDPVPPPFGVGAEPSADRSGSGLPADTPAPAHVGAPPAMVPPLDTGDATTAALPDAAEKTQQPATESTETTPAGRLRADVGIPPLPLRAPKAVAKTKNAKAETKAETKNAKAQAPHPRRTRTAAPRVVVTPAPDAKPGRGDVFPPYIGAYGWRTQAH